jgi:hypothetical protein
MLASACKAMVDGFTNVPGPAPDSRRRDMYVELIASILAFVIALVIIGLFGKLLWNGVVVELFSFAKPARSVWQLIGLMVFLALIR